MITVICSDKQNINMDEQTETPEEQRARLLNDTLKAIGEENEADIFLFSATMNDQYADAFIHALRSLRGNRNKNCILILSTYGGFPDSGYRIVRAIKRHYDKFILYVFGSCKSTGTLVAWRIWPSRRSDV